MFLVNNLLSIVTLVVIIVMTIQFIDILSNYDYITRYVDKYSKWEVFRTPSLNYVDRSVFDPNTDETDKKKKWRCVEYQSEWIAMRANAVQTDVNGPILHKDQNTCIIKLFTNPIISQAPPTPGSDLDTFVQDYDWDEF